MGSWKVATPRLTLPHRGVTERKSVLFPLHLLIKWVERGRKISQIGKIEQVK
jgi:7,8-dihydro-6-hydroxymethylpterin-pyrophosphokinase